MATKVVMAQLSPTMEEGRLVEWKLDEGDEVAQGDVVAEIETDKANMDVESMGEGVLRKRIVGEGETVPVGATIGVIAGSDEDISELLEEIESESAGAAAGESGDEEEPAGAEAGDDDGEAAAAAEASEEETPEEEAPGEEEARAPAGDGGGARGPSTAGETRGDGRLRASPVARRMAEDEGLDLSRVQGSGPAGRIIKRDVEEALERGAARPAAGAPAGPSPLREERVELSQMRKTIAKRLSQSIGPVPHYYLTREIDMGRALELRVELNERGDRSIGVNDLLLKAAAAALVRHPEINASWDGDAIVRHGSVDLGIAVAIEEGLITPVLRDAETKGLEQISEEAGSLIDRARQRDLQPEEYQGATFSISNLGMMGIEEFTAVINPPEAAILAVGKTQEKPVAVDGEVEIRERMRVTMSCDHRVIDGAMGARFLDTFTAMLENPLEMLT